MLIIFILVSQLQSLMADAMDTLEGKKSDKERVWNTIQKVKFWAEGKYILSSEKMSTLGQICLEDKKEMKEVPGVVFGLLSLWGEYSWKN
jgi:hypothetical protein